MTKPFREPVSRRDSVQYAGDLGVELVAVGCRPGRLLLRQHQLGDEGRDVMRPVAHELEGFVCGAELRRARNSVPGTSRGVV